MRVFEPLQELEWRTESGQLMGIYLQLARYTSLDDERNAELSRQLDQWLAEGKVRLVQEPIFHGAGPASIGGSGEVR